MPICKLCALFCVSALFLMAVPCGAAHEELKTFILQHNGDLETATAIADTRRAEKGCFKTASHLVCVETRRHIGARENARAIQAILQGMALHVKNSLYTTLLHAIKPNGFKNPDAARQTYFIGVKNGNTAYLLQGIEFLTFHRDGWFAAIASVPYASSVTAMEKTCNMPFFSKDYCTFLLPRARDLFDREYYSQSLVILKELHDLKCVGADAYILASRAFIETGQHGEAQNIAREILSDLESQLTSPQAEQLGEIFMTLQCHDAAETAYAIAIKKFNGDTF